MKRHPVSRRDFVRSTALSAAVLPLASALRAAEGASGTTATPAATTPATDGPAARWLDGAPPALASGATWGMAWPRGTLAGDTALAVHAPSGAAVPAQSWPLAWWPDGTLKWSAHAVPATPEALAAGYDVLPGTPATPGRALVVTETAEAVLIDTGVIVARIDRAGEHVLGSITRGDREIARRGRLVALSDDAPAAEGTDVRTRRFASRVDRVTVEQRGPVRAVVKVEGQHAGDGRAWLPFSVRLYFYAGGESVRVMHSFVFDGDEHKDFIRGLGLRFDVPLTDEMHDRHVRFAGAEGGIWAEAVRGLTGLRRDPGQAVRAAQIAGQACPPVSSFDPRVRDRLQYIPAWGDYTLVQPAAGAFQIRKRTKPGHGWIDVDQGARAAGLGYIGGPSGGVAFGLRDFWQRHPTQLDIRSAHTDAAEVTLWLWSPDAPAMDLRFYHDGMGMDTYEKQYNGGLEITYEDYEPGWGSPHGIARSSEITLWAVAATPSREVLADMARHVMAPALLCCAPAVLARARVFGGMWALPDASTPARAAIEARLDFNFDFYRRQVEQRHWYGFWNYGDVMHTYDADRHVWRYDVGGFAWDNSELSPDLWLWHHFLRTGRADVFRFAEAMTRHTGEVDVYHAGRFAGLGTRHNVQHWGCSAKQVRISTAAYRRIYYYLTADERVGDLMRELLDVDARLDSVDPARKLKGASPRGGHGARVSFGTDWSNLAAIWLTEWERGGEARCREKLLRGMRDLGAMPAGFFTSDRYGMNLETGALEPLQVRGKAGGSDAPIGVSHLDSVFGAVETFAELIQLTEGQAEYQGFREAWLQYCRLYSAPREEQVAALGAPLRGNGLEQAHSRLTAYAARQTGDAALARRAAATFAREWSRTPRRAKELTGPEVLNPVTEAAWISTNDASQWGLAAIQCLALIPEALD
ncbi:MAG: Tat pathway signal sequence domain protein [Opitutaceae bacterium]|nr:Tat pathway signal sequence domain protein [Opitutaceae bacterium]